MTTYTKTVVEEEGAEVKSAPVEDLCGMTGFLDDRLDGQGKEDGTKGIHLLTTPHAGEDVERDAVGASEHGALLPVTTR